MVQLNGYVKIHRKLLQWGWYSDSVVKDVFLHLLITAAYKDGEFLGHPIKVGQAVIGYDKLSKELGFTVQQIRTALKKLESTKEITRNSTNKFTVVTVENWGDYQLECDSINKPITNEQQTNNKPITASKEIKNIKNISNVDFDDIWKAYPRKEGKADAYKKLPKILKNNSKEEILRAIKRYEDSISDKKFLMHGNTFFNGRYIDYLDANYEDKPQEPEQPKYKFNL